MEYGRRPNVGLKISAGFMLMVMVLIAIIFGTAIGIPGCRNQIKHMQSTVMGLDRVCTVYSLDGTEIKKFEGRFKIEESEGTKTKFTLDDGRAIYISGGVVIIEEQ